MIKLLLIFVALSLHAQTTDSAPRVLASVLFANLGTPANGTVLYCSDCTAASPVASGGSGAFVRRENGAWNGAGGGGCSTTPFSTLFSGSHTATTSNGSLGCGLSYVSTVITDFSNAATTQSIKLGTAASLFSMSGVRIEETVKVLAGGTVTGVQACVGITGSPTSLCSFTPGGLALMTSAGNFQTFAGPYSGAATDLATQDIYLTLTVTAGAGQLPIITAGSVTVRIWGGIAQ